MKNIAIFVSGSGSNCENIIRYFQENPEVAVKLVISNKSDAYALVRAEKLGVPSVVVTGREMREEPEKVLNLVKDMDLLVLAGYLVQVPAYLIEAFPRRIVNIHPALLPKYGGKGMYGHHVHEAVKRAGETESGITIHYVNERLDEGQIIAQFKTPLSPDDTPDDIFDKVHVLELEHFPKVIEEVLKDEIHSAWEHGLPPYLQHDLDAYKEGRRNNSSLLDCLWCELYGSINGAEIDDQAITHEHAQYLRDKFLWHKI